jgi:hypothetical protein
MRPSASAHELGGDQPGMDGCLSRCAGSYPHDPIWNSRSDPDRRITDLAIAPPRPNHRRGSPTLADRGSALLCVGRDFPNPLCDGQAAGIVCLARRGDVLVGVLAPVVAVAYARAPHKNADLVSAWNLFGLADLVDEFRIRTEHAPANFTTLRHMAHNLIRKPPGKDSIRLRRRTAAWDDDFLASLVAA